jgi:hypothetical protein
MPLFLISFTQEEFIQKFVYVLAVGWMHCLERFWWYTGEPCRLCIFQLLNSSGELIIIDGIIQSPHGTLLWYMLENFGVGGAVIVENVV